MGLLSNRIEKEELKAGDHIYSWRAAWSYAHHGIYVGDDKVIHFNNESGQEVGTGAASLDVLLASSIPTRSITPCLVCSSESENQFRGNNGVMSSCLRCFLAGGDLYRFEYAVNRALFLTKAVRGGTCSPATADADEVVIRRAYDSLRTGFGSYSLVKNNCENFATYCKTGSGRPSGQVVSTIATTTTILFGLVVALPVYLAARLVRDSREEEEEDK